LRLGYNFTKNIGVEGFLSNAQTEIQDATQCSPWQDIQSYGIEGLYHFMPESRFVPFIAIGLGGMSFGKGYTYANASYGDRFESNKFAIDYGAGVKFFLTDNIALRADVRHVLPVNPKGNDKNDVYNDLLVTCGIYFAFDGEKKIVEPIVEPIVEEPVVAKEVIVAPKVEEPVVAKEVIVAPKVEEPVVAKPVIMEKGRQTLDVKFDFDKSTIKKGYYKDINSLVMVMKQYPDLNVVIEGHTDSVGKAAYNKKLSQQRANAVKKYMAENGMDANRIKAKGFGMDKPIASNKTKEGRQKNRRVEAAVDYLIEK